MASQESLNDDAALSTTKRANIEFVTSRSELEMMDRHQLGSTEDCVRDVHANQHPATPLSFF